MVKKKLETLRLHPKPRRWKRPGPASASFRASPSALIHIRLHTARPRIRIQWKRRWKKTWKLGRCSYWLGLRSPKIRCTSIPVENCEIYLGQPLCVETTGFTISVKGFKSTHIGIFSGSYRFLCGPYSHKP